MWLDLALGPLSRSNNGLLALVSCLSRGYNLHQFSSALGLVYVAFSCYNFNETLFDNLYFLHKTSTANSYKNDKIHKILPTSNIVGKQITGFKNIVRNLSNIHHIISAPHYSELLLFYN